MRLSARPLALLALLLTMVAAAGAGTGARAPTYFADDPIAIDPETQDASAAKPWEISGPYDFVENTFFRPGDRTPRPAMNTNTVDEVPDSSWFTNRGGHGQLTADQVRRGPDVTDGPAPGTWTVISGKSDGITPGFTIRDTAGVVWFIKFDPISNPEMATGAEMVATKLFWALGYHVPENHLATLVRDNLAIAPEATIRDIRGVRRALTQADVDRLLLLGADNDDDTYRVIASKALEGKPIGPFRYFGTRPDDPNDIFPHEHRRELRGLRVFAAWLNHDDSRSINTLDTLVERNGRRVVWHHLIDFGSTLGSGSVYAQKPRAGNEYIWEARPTIITALTLGDADQRLGLVEQQQHFQAAIARSTVEPTHDRRRRLAAELLDGQPQTCKPIVAVVHCHVAWLGGRHDDGEARPIYPTHWIQENAWRAQRYGVAGRFVHPATGQVVAARVQIGRLLDRLEPTARALGCQAELAGARVLLVGNGADRQREVAGREGMVGLLEWLASETEPRTGAADAGRRRRSA